jgi:antibiotic biosynthesis monooxygenase (ABM) superfamily enzyme
MLHTPRLTGAYNDTELDELGVSAVTVAVAWEPISGFEDPFREALEGLAHAAQHATGALGVALFEPSEGGAYHLIARFRDARTLRDWEESDERSSCMALLLPWVQEVSTVAVHSPEAFFGALAQTSRHSRGRRMLLDVAWFFPASLVATLVVGPLESGLPLLLRVLVGGLSVSVIYAAILGPVRHHVDVVRSRRRPLD